MGFLPLTYNRPAYVEKESCRRDSDASNSTASSYETAKAMRAHAGLPCSGIPEALTFDKIIDGGTCPVSCCYHGPRG